MNKEAGLKAVASSLACMTCTFSLLSNVSSNDRFHSLEHGFDPNWYEYAKQYYDTCWSSGDNVLKPADHNSGRAF